MSFKIDWWRERKRKREGKRDPEWGTRMQNTYHHNIQQVPLETRFLRTHSSLNVNNNKEKSGRHFKFGDS